MKATEIEQREYEWNKEYHKHELEEANKDLNDAILQKKDIEKRISFIKKQFIITKKVLITY